MPETTVNSFVVRFIQEQSPHPGMEENKSWRGVIRHVQSSREKRFTCMEDALKFMNDFLDIDEAERPKSDSYPE